MGSINKCPKCNCESFTVSYENDATSEFNSRGVLEIYTSCCSAEIKSVVCDKCNFDILTVHNDASEEYDFDYDFVDG